MRLNYPPDRMVQELEKKRGSSSEHRFTSPEEMQEAITAFESGVIRRLLWHHRHHILATCCLLEQDKSSALIKLREGILRVNKTLEVANTDTSGYHESVTRFWFEVIRIAW